MGRQIHINLHFPLQILGFEGQAIDFNADIGGKQQFGFGTKQFVNYFFEGEHSLNKIMKNRTNITIFRLYLGKLFSSTILKNGHSN